MTPEDREEKWNEFIDKNRTKLTDSLRIDVEVITHLDSNNVLAQNQLQSLSLAGKTNYDKVAELLGYLKGNYEDTVAKGFITTLWLTRQPKVAIMFTEILDVEVLNAAYSELPSSYEKEYAKNIILLPVFQRMTNSVKPNYQNKSAAKDEADSSSPQDNQNVLVWSNPSDISIVSSEGLRKLAASPSPYMGKVIGQGTYRQGLKRALIMNVTWKRPGTEEDTKNLKECLESCGFKVAVLPPENCAKEGIEEGINHFLKELEHCKDELGTCFVAFMSHGKSDDECSDQKGKTFSLRSTIISRFNAEKSQFLEHIPKVFLINMCRGKDDDGMPVVLSDSFHDENPSVVLTNKLEWSKYFSGLFRKKPVPMKPDENPDFTPLWMHTLIVMSTSENNHAYRLESADKKIATTAFFNTFCKVIKENAKKPADIQQLLQHVSYEMSQQSFLYKMDVDGKEVLSSVKQLPLIMNYGFCYELPIKYTEK